MFKFLLLVIALVSCTLCALAVLAEALATNNITYLLAAVGLGFITKLIWDMIEDY